MNLEVHENKAAIPPVQKDPVLVVDDEPLVRDLLSNYLRGAGYQCATAGTGRQALDMLEKSPVSLVIADIRMPELNGLQLLEKLTLRHPDTAAIMITAVADIETAIDTMKKGASDYITKPFDLINVAESVDRALSLRRSRLEDKKLSLTLESLVQEKTLALSSALQDISSHHEMTLDMLMKVLDARGHETQCHSQRVQAYTLRLAEQMGFPDERMVDLARGSLLHDIGKVGIPDSILLKPGKLTSDEWETMKTHTLIGYQILTEVPFLDQVAEMVLSHHERWDGRGYPRGIEQDKIPVEARIFSILDAYDAMTSNRPYRDANSVDFARQEIADGAGSQFDESIVQKFLTVAPEEWLEIGKRYRERSQS